MKKLARILISASVLLVTNVALAERIGGPEYSCRCRFETTVTSGWWIFKRTRTIITYQSIPVSDPYANCGMVCGQLGGSSGIPIPVGQLCGDDVVLASTLAELAPAPPAVCIDTDAPVEDPADTDAEPLVDTPPVEECVVPPELLMSVAPTDIDPSCRQYLASDLMAAGIVDETGQFPIAAPEPIPEIVTEPIPEPVIVDMVVPDAIPVTDTLTATP